MSIEQEIRDTIERNKAIREEVGQMNCTLSKLEHKCEQYMKASDEAYQKGYEGGKKSIERGCKGCTWESQKGYDEPCKHCCNAYLNQYVPIPKQDDSIKVGDEVISLKVNGDAIEGLLPWVIVTRLDDSYGGIDANGVVHSHYKNMVRKTGRHFDIEGILEAMRT